MLLVRTSTSLATRCSSQDTGTPAAEKIFFTASEISGPTPGRGGEGGGLSPRAPAGTHRHRILEGWRAVAAGSSSSSTR